MIRLTAQDLIRGKGDLQLDGMLVKKHYFEKQTTGLGRESLVIEATPFVRLDDNSIICNTDDVAKINIPDLDAKIKSGALSAECIQAVVDAYIATEKANAMLLTELTKFTCEWEAPQ